MEAVETFAALVTDIVAPEPQERRPPTYVKFLKPGEPIPHPLFAWLPEIEQLASQCMQPSHIATYLGFEPEEMHAAMEKYPAISWAIRGGRSRGIADAGAALMRAVYRGDVSAIKARLKLDGYGVTAPSGPAVVVNIGDQKAPVTIESVNDLMDEQRALIEGPKG